MWAYNEPDIYKKISMARSQSSFVLSNNIKVKVPELPARDALILDFKSHPVKKGFSTHEGQARMLHDLASIELQAMELGLRTLSEFPNLPTQFKEELLDLTLNESEHLEMCLTEIQNLGFKWGDWPINCGLWTCVSPEDSVLDRILIVHRYLEGSGLDAGDTLLKRLAGVDAKPVQQAVKIINTDEIGHVLFGTRWYFRFCKEQGIDPSDDFFSRMDRLRGILPKRISPINHELRTRSGFTENEISYLENLRLSFLEKDSPYKIVR